MRTTSLEAFSDGVIAVLMTIMVLELWTPPGHDWAAPMTPSSSYTRHHLIEAGVAVVWLSPHRRMDPHQPQV